MGKIKFKTVKDNISKTRRSIEGLNGKRVNVGVIGENAWLAGIHEYGCRIKVTEKMRAWLHANGLHLRKETTEIVIPERGFLRNGFDECHKEVINKTMRFLPMVLDGNMSGEILCGFAGLELSIKIKEYSRELSNPANHPFTVARKGSANPLVNTGNMINSISYEVE